MSLIPEHAGAARKRRPLALGLAQERKAIPQAQMKKRSLIINNQDKMLG
jgi:hypothetical protein